MRTKIFTFLSSLRLLGFAFGLTMLLGSGGFAQNYENRLVNPGFEDGFNTGWLNWMPDYNFVETDASNVHSGVKSIALKPGTWTGSGFGQSITTGFSAGESYTFSAYGKIVGTTAGRISVQFIDGDGIKTNISGPDFAVNGEFEMKSLTVTVPEGTATILPHVWYDNGDGSVFYVDDLRFVLEAPNLLVNPGFENGFASGWLNWMPDNNVIETDMANVHGGAQSVALKPVNWSGSGFGQTITTGFTAGQILIFSGYGKVAGATSGHISIQFKDAGGNKTNFHSADFANTGSFEMQSLVVAIPAGTVEIIPNVWYDNNDGSILYVDDLKITLQGMNILVNPDFENGFASGWLNWMPDYNVVETDPDNVQSGAKSVSLHPVNWSGSGFGQTITAGFTAGETCVFSGYGKVTGATSGHLAIQFKDAGGNKTNVFSPDFANTGAFVMQSLSAVIPEGTVEVIPNVWYDNNDGSVLTVDNFTFSTPYKAPVVTKMLRGTGFEYTPGFVNVTGGGVMPDTLNGVIAVCDGTGATDVTAELQMYLDSAAVAGKPLLIPATDGFYKITKRLFVKTSVIGIGGTPVIKQTGTAPVDVYNNSEYQILRLEDNMTGWIYNLHLIGTYDGVSELRQEFAYAIAVSGVNGVTIKNNIIERPQGDCIADDGGQAPSRNVLITNNNLIEAYRNGVACASICDRWAIMNNYLTYHSRFVNPIDLEPYQDASRVTNVEVAYNNIYSPELAWNDENHFYNEVFKVTAWHDPSDPGGNIFSHHNWGEWGVQWTQVTGYHGGPSEWYNVEDLNNVEGSTIPGTNPAMPTTPADLLATAVDKTSVILTWTASTSSVGVKGYLVYKDGVLLGTTIAASDTLTGLDCAKVYSVVVKAYDTEGNVSNATQAVTARPVDCSGGLNKIMNPGIEEPLSVGWTGDWGNNSVDTTSFKNGMQSLHIDGEGGRAQSLTLTPDSSYTLSAWAKLSDISDQAAYFGVQFQNAASEKTTSTVNITDTLWAQYYLSVKVPADAVSTIVFQYVEGRGDAVNYALTDDWSLVPAIPVTSVTLSKTEVTLPVGIVQQVKATIEPLSATNPTIIWSSSNPEVASVNKNGLVQGLKTGSATISATSQDGELSASCEVTVNPPTKNLLQNPGIEKPLTIGWTGDWGNNKTYATEQHSDKNSLAIGPNDGGRAQSFIGFVPGSTYTLSAWGKLIGTGFSGQKTYIGAIVKDANGKWISNPTVVITDSTAWQQYSLTFTLPFETTAVDIFVYLEGRGLTTSYTLTDDWGLISGWEPLPYIPTSISSNNRDNFKLYPNPMTGQSLTIEGVESAKSISIFDMTGRLVLNQSLQKTNNQSIILNEKLRKGSYIVKIETSTESLSRLLIVQ